MPYDAFHLHHSALELNDILTDSKINKITQTSLDDIFLNVYTGVKSLKLHICTNASGARVCFTSLNKENPITAFNFCMLLRKHLTGATIKKIVCLENFERILLFAIETTNELSDSENLELYVEVMGKYSNIILVKDGIILGALKSCSLDTNSKRVLLSNAKFSLPPPQDKILLSETGKLKELLAGSLPISSDFLFQNIKGISAQTAKEMLDTFSKVKAESLDSSHIDELVSHIQNFYFSPKLLPCVLVKNKIIDFYIYPFKDLDGKLINFDSVLQAISYFFEKKEEVAKRDSIVRELESKVNHFITKLKKKIDIVTKTLDSCLNLEENRIKGELVTCYMFKLSFGMQECVVENYYDDNKPIKIVLDKNLSISQNAQRFYKKYNKQKSTLAIVAKQKDELENEFSYLLSIKESLQSCENETDFEDVKNELKKGGYLAEKIVKNYKNTKKKNELPSLPLSFEIDGFKVEVGKNNIQNDRLTFSAKPNDIWLHVKDYHGSHVIIRSENKDVPNSVIEKSAEKAVYYSNAKNAGKVTVDYCLKKYVVKQSGGKLGQVIYTNFKGVLVEPKKI